MALDPFQCQDVTAVAGGAGAEQGCRLDLVAQPFQYLRLPAQRQDRVGELRPCCLEEGVPAVTQQDATGIRVGEPRGDRRGSPDHR